MGVSSVSVWVLRPDERNVMRWLSNNKNVAVLWLVLCAFHTYASIHGWYNF